jgi:AcrR family transcriptional regulator
MATKALTLKRVRKTRGTGQRRAATAVSLSREVIIAAALKQIDADGLEDFSIRTLARRLSVFPTAIYWYVPTRNQLLADVVALVLGDVPVATHEDVWQDYVRRLFKAYRESLRTHPNAAPLVGAQLVSNASVNLDFLEGLLALLSKAGFAGEILVAAYNSVIASLVGFVTQEFAPVPKENTAEWRRDIQARLGKPDAARFPVLAANIKLLANRAFILRWQSGMQSPLERSFALYTEAQIAALESLLIRN